MTPTDQLNHLKFARLKYMNSAIEMLNKYTVDSNRLQNNIYANIWLTQFNNEEIFNKIS